ncbi:MAG: hypothetical protein KGJ59_11185 [Bacteroidota bacterium]|nr:hypothetical protein [Bacteroidota bacterium]
MKKSNILLKALQYVVAIIGITAVVYGFITDEDLVTFMGVFLALAPFFVSEFIKRSKSF